MGASKPYILKFLEIASWPEKLMIGLFLLIFVSLFLIPQFSSLVLIAFIIVIIGSFVYLNYLISPRKRLEKLLYAFELKKKNEMLIVDKTIELNKGEKIEIQLTPCIVQISTFFAVGRLPMDIIVTNQRLCAGLIKELLYKPGEESFGKLNLWFSDANQTEQKIDSVGKIFLGFNQTIKNLRIDNSDDEMPNLLFETHVGSVVYNFKIYHPQANEIIKLY